MDQDLLDNFCFHPETLVGGRVVLCLHNNPHQAKVVLYLLSSFKVWSTQVRNRCEKAWLGLCVASLFWVVEHELNRLSVSFMISETWTTSVLSQHVHSQPFPVGYSCRVLCLSLHGWSPPSLVLWEWPGPMSAWTVGPLHSDLALGVWWESRNWRSRAHGMFLYNPSSMNAFHIFKGL